jgi:serine protease
MFKHKPIPAHLNIPDISRILKVEIPEEINPLSIIREFSKDPSVEYAEPVYKREFFDVPDDPKYPDQNHLPQIKTPEAWDIQKGDSNVVIAIVDGGVDLNHEDLKANLWINEPEANGASGVDDDGNGYIDDIHGWDFGDDDADPSNVPGFIHGTPCAGLACAVTNNGIGVSGVSWNCKLIPVKLSTGHVFPNINGHLGIIYAADNGADVISNSWGGYGYLQWEQDVINYAHGKGSIIVCAAGNDGTDLMAYPAAYQHAVSVSAVRTDDLKIDYSSFGPSRLCENEKKRLIIHYCSVLFIHF